MNEFRTTVVFASGRWEAESSAMIDGTARELSISTARDSSGVVRSRATVSRIDGHLKSHVIGFGSPSGDFSKTVLSMRHRRATEKAIRLQHETAIAQVESILFQVRQHYAVRDVVAKAEHDAVPATSAANAEVAA
jgi:hypothetical protein